jgi:hypothetical protein
VKRIQSILVLVIVLFAGSLIAQTKVVVIPLIKNKIIPNQECPDPTYMLGIDTSGNIVCGSSSFCSRPDAKVTGVDASLNFLCSFPGKKIAFISSTSSNGNLGGLTGADQKCQTLADSAGIHGTFKAWLGDSTKSPSNRFTQATVPYVKLDGSLIANHWTDLTDGDIANPINIDENGDGAGTLRVWTGTNSVGGLPNPIYSCVDWSNGGEGVQAFAEGSVGDTGLNVTWANNGVKEECSGVFRLYCFEQ